MRTIKVWILEDQEAIADFLLNFLPLHAQKLEREVEIKWFESPGDIPVESLEGLPDIVFLDMEMPTNVPSGLRFLRNIKTTPKGSVVKIIAMSGRPNDFRQAALYSGANSFLAKPFEMSALRDVFKKVIGAIEE